MMSTSCVKPKSAALVAPVERKWTKTGPLVKRAVPLGAGERRCWKHLDLRQRTGFLSHPTKSPTP